MPSSCALSVVVNPYDLERGRLLCFLGTLFSLLSLPHLPVSFLLTPGQCTWLASTGLECLGSAREGVWSPVVRKFVPIHPASLTGFIPPKPWEMGLARLAGRGLAGWVQGGAGRGGFCKGDMAEWTQELETFAGAAVASGGERGGS